jgi:hypothetical protein
VANFGEDGVGRTSVTGVGCGEMGEVNARPSGVPSGDLEGDAGGADAPPHPASKVPQTAKSTSVASKRVLTVIGFTSCHENDRVSCLAKDKK